MKAGIIVFPGTNCDTDTQKACEYIGIEADLLWHGDVSTLDYDFVFLPGGFSYGDYIYSGKYASFSPSMDKIQNYIDSQRGVVIGICNGFQILCEAGMLPGTLLINDKCRFICRPEKCTLSFDGKKQDIIIPIAHKEGRYYNNKPDENHIEVFLRYENNPNGSQDDIAGIYDSKKRIFGMMSHPERCVLPQLGLTDGVKVFECFKEALNG